MDPAVTMRHQVGTPAGPGTMAVTGGIVPGFGALVRTVFTVSLEESSS